METVGAVLVAAGMSSRSEEFLPLLPVGGITIAQRIIATLRQAGATRIAVVTGFHADELEHHLAKTGAVFLRNENYQNTDMFASACIGLSYLRHKCARVFFAPTAVPLFTAATAKALLDSGAPLAVPVCGGVRGHPILLSAGVIDRLLNDSGEGGLQGALSRCGVEETLVPVRDSGTVYHGSADSRESARLLAVHNSQLARAEVRVALSREHTFLDERSALLLQLIDETGSVREACQKMQLSYSSGWNSLRLLENEMGCPVVVRTQGGAGGGRSSLTPAGRRLLWRYQQLQAELNARAEQLFHQYFEDLFFT